MQVVSPWEKAQQRHQEAPSDVPAQTEFSGRRGRLFWLALRTGVLTVLTLGFYRFWMKTRLRRWYWSSWRPGGHPMEYLGDPWEKLLGFLIAVVFLAFYIGIVNLLLMFASFSLFNGNVAAYVLSFLGVVPLWFYARYRARRYVLARTRWRGVRFGLEPGAWGYAGRALWHWFLTIITLGLLWPRKAFYLEKYITDRTYFGTQKLRQDGAWRALFRPFLGVWVPGLVLAIAGVSAIAWETDAAFLSFGAAILIVPLWLPAALINYNVKKLRYLTSHKTAGEAALKIEPRFWRVSGIYLLGYSLASFVAMLLLSPLVIAVILMVETHTSLTLMGELPFEAPSQLVFSILAVVLYFLIFLMWSVLMHTFIRYPLMRHYASVLTIQNIQALDAVSQRPRDEFGEAEGFAEALDVGAAI